MNYEEIVKYIQSKCQANIFIELDNFLTDLDDTQEDVLELENNKFKIRKDIVKTDFKSGIVNCKYNVVIL